MFEPNRGEPPKPQRFKPDPADEAEFRAALGDIEARRLLEVDGEAYLRWLAGEGPDPCPPKSSG